MRISYYALFILITLLYFTAATKTASAQGQIQIIFNGQQLQSDVPPEILNDRTMVPIRVISEGLGADVTWNSNTQTVTVKQADLTYTLTIGKNTAGYLSDYGKASIQLDAPPYIKSGRTMVPLRYLAESLGLDVEWNDGQKTVYINTVKPIPVERSFNFHAFKEMGNFSCGLAPVINENGVLGYVDVNGNLVIPYQFDMAINNADYTKPDFVPEAPAPFNDYDTIDFYAFSKYGYAYVKKNGDYFYIDKTGNRIDNTFSGRYYSAGPFVNGRAAAQKTEGGLFGYIDEKGDPITDFKYLSASNFKDGVAKVVLAIPASSYTGPAQDDWKPVFKEAGGNPYPHFNGCPSSYVTEPVYDDGTMLIDVYLDTDGNVLQSKYQEPPESEAYFRSGVNFELYDNNKGEFLTDAELADIDPNILTSIISGFFDPRGKGVLCYIEYKNGSQYYIPQSFYDEINNDNGFKFLRAFYLLEADGRVRYDCTDAVKDIYLSNVPNSTEDEFYDPNLLGPTGVNVDKEPYANIYYLRWTENPHAAPPIIGFWTID